MRKNSIGITGWIEKKQWFWSYCAVILIWVFICILTGEIAVKTLLMNITLASFLIIAGLGQMIVITSGDGAIDLSVSYTITLSAFILTCITRDGNNLLLGIIVALAVSILAGYINGIISVKLRVPPIITTLAIGYMEFTCCLLLQRIPQGSQNNQWSSFTKFQYNGISSLLIISLVLCVIVAFILYKTKYGKQLHALGQGALAAELAGIRAKRVKIIAFMSSGLMAGISGILISGYSEGAYISIGTPYLLNSIAAVIVGGTLVSGGRSSVIGTIGGAVLLTLLGTLLTLTNIAAGYRYLIQGAIFILILVASETKKQELIGQ